MGKGKEMEVKECKETKKKKEKVWRWSMEKTSSVQFSSVRNKQRSSLHLQSITAQHTHTQEKVN